MFNFSFADFQDFLIMDGHGIYVWTVYLVTSALIAVSFLIVRHKLNVLKRKLENASALKEKTTKIFYYHAPVSHWSFTSFVCT